MPWICIFVFIGLYGSNTDDGLHFGLVVWLSYADRVLLKSLADAACGSFNVTQLTSEWVWEPE